MAPGPLETPRRSAVGLQRDLEIAFDGGLNLPSLDPPNLQSNSQVKLDVDVVNPAALLVVVASPVAGVEGDDVIAPERGAEVGGVLVALVEGFEILGAKPLALVERGGFEVVVVDADALVGVADGEVEGEVVVEGAVGGGEVELGEGGVVHVEFDLVGAEDEPEDQRQNAQNHQEAQKGNFPNRVTKFGQQQPSTFPSSLPFSFPSTDTITNNNGGGLRRQRPASTVPPPWSSTVARGCGGSGSSACNLAEEDGGADGGGDGSVAATPAARDGGRMQQRWWPPASPFSSGGARRRLGTAAFPFPRRHEDSSPSSAALYDDDGRSSHSSVSGENSSGTADGFLSSVRGSSSNSPPSLRIAAAERLGGGPSSRQRPASTVPPPWSSTVARGCGGSGSSACNLAEEDGGADGGGDGSVAATPAARDGGRMQQRWWPPASPFSSGGARRRLGTAAFPFPRRHEDSSPSSAALYNDDGRSSHSSVSGDNSSGRADGFLSSVRGSSSNSPPSLRIAAAERLGAKREGERYDLRREGRRQKRNMPMPLIVIAETHHLGRQRNQEAATSPSAISHRSPENDESETKAGE
nr:hypothetical protein SOVF_158540 [Ipomoea batatas]